MNRSWLYNYFLIGMNTGSTVAKSVLKNFDFALCCMTMVSKALRAKGFEIRGGRNSFLAKDFSRKVIAVRLATGIKIVLKTMIGRSWCGSYSLLLDFENEKYSVSQSNLTISLVKETEAIDFFLSEII